MHARTHARTHARAHTHTHTHTHMHTHTHIESHILTGHGCVTIPRETMSAAIKGKTPTGTQKTQMHTQAREKELQRGEMQVFDAMCVCVYVSVPVPAPAP